MNVIFILILATLGTIVGYGWYARRIDRQIIQADAKKTTPATMYMDGVDFTPANKSVLFGYQFKSIAALGPITGPIVAMRWGWLPALLWIIFGTFFIGWVQDYASAIVAMREDGKTFGGLSFTLISPRSRNILLIFIYAYLWLIMAAFGQLIAQLLAGASVPLGVLATIAFGILAGQMIYRWKQDILLTTAVTVVLSFVGIWLGTQGFVKDFFQSVNGGATPGILFADIPRDRFLWAVVVMVLCYLGAVLPIWRWAQPINYVAFWIVALGMVGGVLGLLIWHPSIGSDFPAFTSWDGKFEGIAKAAGPLWPLLFVTIACGAISGWHSLVSSSGTARQLEKETDALPVGGGAMFMEMFLATLSLLTAAVGVGATKFAELSGKGANLGVFSNGLGTFLSKVGIPTSFGTPYASVFLVLMGLTIMYLVVRFMRVASAEVLGDRFPAMKNMHIGSFVALLLSLIIILIGLSQGGFAGDFFKRIWVLFGGANQLMAALALLIITLWLIQKGKNYQWTLWPFLFMFVTTIVALVLQVIDSFKDLSNEGVTGLLVVGDLIAGGVGILLIVCALILAWDGWQAVQRMRAAAAKAKA